MSKFSASGRKSKAEAMNPYVTYLLKIKIANTKKELKNIGRYADINMNLTNEEIITLNNLIVNKIKEAGENENY